MASAPPDSTVLIIEDDQEIAELYAEWLGEEYQVRVANTGEHALELVDETVEVALVDRRLPGMSGDEVVARLRQQHESLQIAMITAVDPDFDVLAMGFDEYLVKPVTKPQLHELVQSLRARLAYDQSLRTSFQLLTKRALLQTVYVETELTDNPDYQQLEAEIEAHNAALEETRASFTDGDFEALFRRIDRIPW